MTTTTQKELDEHSIRYLTRNGARLVTRQRHERLKRVDALLTGGVPNEQIVSTVADEFGVSTATVNDDIELLYENWAVRDKRSRPLMRQQVTQMFHTVFRLAIAAGRFSAANQAALGIARIHGLTGPDQHAHVHLHADHAPRTIDDMQADLNELTERLKYKADRLERAANRPTLIDASATEAPA